MSTVVVTGASGFIGRRLSALLVARGDRVVAPVRSEEARARLPQGVEAVILKDNLDSELLALWAAQGLTTIFVTHSIYEAVFLSTRVAVMGARPGRVIADVPIDEPHPRSDAFRVSTTFARHCQRLSALVAEAGAAAPSPAVTAR